MQDHTGLVPQGPQLVFLDIATVNQYLAFIPIVKADDQIGYRRLAGAARADKGDNLAILCCETDIAQNLIALCIGK